MRTEPINHVETLGFSPFLWELLASARENNKTPPRFIIPVSMQPLLGRDPKFKELTKRKVDALVTLMHSYFPDVEIELLMGDTLYLRNHRDPENLAATHLQTRKKEWGDLLGLPVEQLSEATPTGRHTYALHHAFCDEHPNVQPPANKSITLSSWSKYQHPELDAFMLQLREGLQKILATGQPADILLNDEKLFGADYLGFAKKALESIITKDIGYQGVNTDQFLEFIGTFSHTAIHHLKKLYAIEIPMCRANATNEKRTADKKQIFDAACTKAPQHDATPDFISSFSYLLNEFIYFAQILLTTPQAQSIPKTTPLYLFYACGMPCAPVYHPIYKLNYFLKAVSLPRGFLACAEFPLSLKNNDQLSSSNRGTSEMKDKPNEGILIPQNASPPPQQQPSNGSPADEHKHTSPPNSAASKRRSDSHQVDSAGEDMQTASASSSASQDDGMFEADPIRREDDETLKKKMLEAYLLKYAEQMALEDDGEAYAKSLMDVMVRNRTNSKASSSVGKTFRPSKSTGNSSHDKLKAANLQGPQDNPDTSKQTVSYT